MKSFSVNQRSESYNRQIFENVSPVKVTECRHMKLYSFRWGLITDYHLESVKINCYKSGEISSSATLRVGDYSGEVICLIKGPSVGLLFGLSKQKWMELENMSIMHGQLFYRYFKNGLSSGFSYEQKLFYYFCSTQQIKDVLVAVFQRCPNLRKRNNNEAFLQIAELRKLNTSLLDLYKNGLNNNVLTNN